MLISLVFRVFLIFPENRPYVSFGLICGHLVVQKLVWALSSRRLNRGRHDAASRQNSGIFCDKLITLGPHLFIVVIRGVSRENRSRLHCPSTQWKRRRTRNLILPWKRPDSLFSGLSCIFPRSHTHLVLFSEFTRFLTVSISHLSQSQKSIFLSRKGRSFWIWCRFSNRILACAPLCFSWRQYLTWSEVGCWVMIQRCFQLRLLSSIIYFKRISSKPLWCFLTGVRFYNRLF